MNYREPNKKSPIPLYYQLAEWIREEISAGHFMPGSQLPSERELSDRMGISRMTVRQAISYLVSEGLLVSHQGVGTFVAEPKLVHNTLNLLGFTEEMTRQGEHVTSQVLEQEVVIASRQVASHLQLADGDAVVKDEVVKIVRLRRVNNVPILLETSFVPLALCPGLENADLADQSLYALMAEAYQIQLQRSSQSIEVTVVNQYEQQLLGVDERMCMLLLRGVTYARNDQPVEYFKALYRGDRFKFTVDSQLGDGVHAAVAPATLGLVFAGKESS